MLDSPLPDKATVETHAFGTFGLHAYNASEFWSGEDHLAKLGEKIRQVIDRLHSEKLLRAIAILRLMIVTSDLVGVAKYWGDQLGNTGSVTQHELGRVAGKMLVWGDGEPETTYAVAILDESLIYGFLVDEEVAQETAKHLLVHELAHIDTEFLYLGWFGNELPDGWTYLQRKFAHIIWGEFHAEVIARAISSVQDEAEINAMFINLLTQCIHSINTEIDLYRHHRNMSTLFQFVGSQLNMLIAQTGRCLGATHHLTEEKLNVEAFLCSISEVSLDWQDVTARVYAVLRTGMVSQDNYDLLAGLMFEYFHCVGLVPQLRSNGEIWIDVVTP